MKTRLENLCWKIDEVKSDGINVRNWEITGKSSENGLSYSFRLLCMNKMSRTILFLCKKESLKENEELVAIFMFVMNLS